MKSVSMSGSPRENVGKKDAKKVRREGNIPCVIYGGEKQTQFVVNYQDFEKLIFSPDVFLVTIEVDGNAYKSVLQEVQYHPVTDSILHADFVEVSDKKPIIVGLPVHLSGSSVGVMAGGQLIKKMHRVRARGLVKDMPEFIEVDITDLVIGSSVKIKDLEAENLDFLDPDNAVIVRVKTARTLAEIEGEVEEDEEEEGEEGEEGEAGTEEGAEGAAETEAKE